MTTAPYKLWGTPGEDFDYKSLDQLRTACQLPVARAGALMPDAHLGYGLPIGGVLATENAVVPYAVGVDIACRVKLSVFDLPAKDLEHESGRDRLTKAIETETRFGVGAAFSKQREKRRNHPVLDRDWSVSPVTKANREKAWAQLGTSGSGNHFVEFGVLTVPENIADLSSELANEHDSDTGPPGGVSASLGLEPGTYLALLSHSGSRGAGAAVCNHYSKLAMKLRPNLEGGARHLAWLDLDSDAGREYWAAMNLMGEYASANHACIHEGIRRHLGARTIAGVENHHNFAWKETHDLGEGPKEYVVHRKGATPAGAGVLGVIPGTMADPAYIVVGKGGEGSLDSASHGAGRVMSRTQAKKTFRWAHVKHIIDEAGVTLMSAGIDENPRVYKDIRRVLGRQTDLATPIAKFQPRLVKMAPAGERPED
ncbi:MAG: RtcB family protein [Planctomycetota bacterium]